METTSKVKDSSIIEAALWLAEFSVDSPTVTEDETSDDEAELIADWSVFDPDVSLDTVDLVLYGVTADSQDVS